MGCEFDIHIQVLYGGCWIDIVCLETRTGCGGYPLTPVPRLLATQHNIKGDYGVEFPTLKASEEEVILYNKAVGEDNIYKMSVKETKKRKHCHVKEAKMSKEQELGENEKGETNNDDSSVDDEEAEEEDDDGGELSRDDYEANEHLKCFVYYSKEQFSLFNTLIDPRIFRGTCYTKQMEPVPGWCEIALSSLPFGGWGWMPEEPEDIEEISELLRDQTQSLKTKYCSYLMIQLRGLLPAELIREVAEYATPRASDVRVAFKDEEGQSERIRAGDESGDNSAPEECTIM